MARLSDEDRKVARMARDKFMRRLRDEQKDTREDGVFAYRVAGQYALTHDDWPCPLCGTPCLLEVDATELHTRKTWRCSGCRTTTIGQFSTYVIHEWPGS